MGHYIFVSIKPVGSSMLIKNYLIRLVELVYVFVLEPFDLVGFIWHY
jgi:hypothetical protein